jgi:parvulin-like peptidyl-prolyl isomerase
MAKRQVSVQPGLTRKQASRAKREARIQRIVLITAGVIGAAVLLLVAYGLINQYWLQPRKVLATVNGETINATEFEDRVKFEYFLYSIQPYNFQPFDASGIMDQMVNEILISQKAEELGITVDDDELDERIELAFGYDAGDPEPTATPYPTIANEDATATITPTFVWTLTPSPTVTLDPSITPSATPESTEEATAEGTDEATAEPTEAITNTPEPTATPLDEEAYTTRVDEFIQNGVTLTDLSEDKIRGFIRQRIQSGILSEKLMEELEFDLDESKALVNAAHILVATEEEAQELRAQIVDEGAVFEEVAAEHSTDTSNNYRGGNLGWFGSGDMVAAFEEAAFATEIGEISEPVQTDFGWHLIKVYDKIDQPTTFFEQEGQKQEQFQAMIEEWKEDADIEIEENIDPYIPEIAQPQQQQP